MPGPPSSLSSQDPFFPFTPDTRARASRPATTPFLPQEKKNGPQFRFPRSQDPFSIIAGRAPILGRPRHSNCCCREREKENLLPCAAPWLFTCDADVSPPQIRTFSPRRVLVFFFFLCPILSINFLSFFTNSARSPGNEEALPLVIAFASRLGS